MAIEHEINIHKYPEQLIIKNAKGEPVSKYHYDPEKEIGRGGSARVVEGVDDNGNVVAVKLLSKTYSDNQYYKEIFTRQAETIIAFNQAVPGSFVKIYDHASGSIQVMEKLIEDNFVINLIENNKIDRKMFLDIIKKTAKYLAEILQKTNGIHGDLDSGAIIYDSEKKFYK